MKSVDDAQIHAIVVPHFADGIFASQKKKLVERFIEFKQSAPNAPVRSNSSDPSSLLLTWGRSDYFTQAEYGQAPPRNSPRLFDFHYDFGLQTQHSKLGALPFADGEFDWVFCDSVIEHMGPLERQYLVLKELNRVARAGIFVTTFNRWHPLEFYSGLPFAHWLPEAWWRRVLKWIGSHGFATDAPLNLVGSKELGKLARLLPNSPSFSIGHIRHLGIKASFFLQIRKPPYVS